MKRRVLEFVKGKKVVRFETEEEYLNRLSSTPTLSRGDFLVACVNAGIITEEAADIAAEGKWPQEFDSFLSGLSRDQRIRAKALWVDSTEVRRDSTLLQEIAENLGVSPEQVNALFGIGE